MASQRSYLAVSGIQPSQRRTRASAESKAEKQVVDDFSQTDHEKWLYKIGNLVLISRRKNSELSNADFPTKKRRYFSGNIDAFPNSVRVMENDTWLPEKIEARQREMIKELKRLYE